MRARPSVAYVFGRLASCPYGTLYPHRRAMRGFWPMFGMIPEGETRLPLNVLNAYVRAMGNSVPMQACRVHRTIPYQDIPLPRTYVVSKRDRSQNIDVKIPNQGKLLTRKRSGNMAHITKFGLLTKPGQKQTGNGVIRALEPLLSRIMSFRMEVMNTLHAHTLAMAGQGMESDRRKKTQALRKVVGAMRDNVMLCSGS
ncbi:hypothetical protein BDN70DRAFT_879395 [Pholiota conissans]|uniref:Uncharacterized protein n=1 Tax=Pholiota conissans TaxID=109636 RepID=A0A9P6D013_9AGAR|nr:hypothetical protein BDN70DRAFT_879395 [Pholiota conissans]